MPSDKEVGAAKEIMTEEQKELSAERFADFKKWAVEWLPVAEENLARATQREENMRAAKETGMPVYDMNPGFKESVESAIAQVKKALAEE